MSYELASLFIVQDSNEVTRVQELLKNIKADVQVAKQVSKHADLITELARILCVDLLMDKLVKFDTKTADTYNHFQFQIYLFFFHNSNEEINMSSRIYLINKDKAGPIAKILFGMVSSHSKYIFIHQ